MTPEETLQELLPGPGLCSSDECKGYCGVGHANGCEAVKVFLADHGGANYRAVSQYVPASMLKSVAEAVHDAVLEQIPFCDECVGQGIDIDLNSIISKIWKGNIL